MQPLTDAEVGKIISKTSAQVTTLDDGTSTQRTIPDIPAAIKLAYELGYNQGADETESEWEEVKADTYERGFANGCEYRRKNPVRGTRNEPN